LGTQPHATRIVGRADHWQPIPDPTGAW
jgi:hypothetical protein